MFKTSTSTRHTHTYTHRFLSLLLPSIPPNQKICKIYTLTQESVKSARSARSAHSASTVASNISARLGRAGNTGGGSGATGGGGGGGGGGKGGGVSPKPGGVGRQSPKSRLNHGRTGGAGASSSSIRAPATKRSPRANTRAMGGRAGWV